MGLKANFFFIEQLLDIEIAIVYNQNGFRPVDNVSGRIVTFDDVNFLYAGDDPQNFLNTEIK
ncbi:hypothetical protein GCM10028807_37640 [Spirosoma daeguense]